MNFLLIAVFGWQGTIKKSPESKQYMVAIEWFAWGPAPPANVHSVASYIYCGNHGTHSPHLLVLWIACGFPNTQDFSSCMEWGKLSTRGNAEAGDSQREEEIRNAASTSWARPIINCGGKCNEGRNLGWGERVPTEIKLMVKSRLRNSWNCTFKMNRQQSSYIGCCLIT